VTLRNAWRRHSVPVLLALVPAVVWLFPILTDPFHTVVGWEGDNLFFIRQIWWVKHSLLDLGIAPWFDPSSYWPHGYAMTRGELTLANSLPVLPITAVFGPVAAYNLMLTAGFFLTGIATYAWAYRLTESRGAAMVAAVIAVMAPYRLARASGHLNVITTQWFCFALWTFEEYWRANTTDPQLPQARRWAIALGLSLGLIALSSWYSAYQACLLIPVYVVARSLQRPAVWRTWRWYSGLAVAMTVAVVLVLPALVSSLRAGWHGELTRQFSETMYWSLNAYDFFIPNAEHPLLNRWMQDRFPKETSEWPGRAVSLGYVAIALAVVSLIANRRKKYVVLPLVAVGVVSASIALGPVLHWADKPVLVPVSHSTIKAVDWSFSKVRPMSTYRAPMRKAQEVWIPLPALAMWLVVPGTSGMRALSRFGYWTLLMTAGLAALGTQWLLRRVRGARSRRVVAIVLALGVTLECWSSKTLTRWEPRPVDRWISTLAENDVVLELPVTAAGRPAQDYYVTVQQHRTILGPRGDSFPPPVLFERWPVLGQLPSDAALQQIRLWGATLLVIDAVSTERWPDWEQMFHRAKAREVARFGETRVYRLN